MYVQPGYLFRRMHQRATAAFGAVNDDLAITAVQFAALLAIRDNPGVDATRVAEMIHFDRTTIGHVIGRLEQKGLIVRSEGSLDKRTKQLRITPQGSALVETGGQRTEAIADRLLGPLIAAERAELLRLLRKLEQHEAEDGDDADSQP